jgi:phytol kinase
MTSLERDALGILVVGLLCLAVLGLAEGLRAFLLVEAEKTRKLVHVGIGLVAATFPWLFRSAWPVVVLAAAFAALLGAARLSGRLASVHGIERDSLGTLCFPLAVALLFALCFARPAIYRASILVLAVGDAAAALCGRTWGRHLYDVGGGTKSLEGSAALLVVAFGIVLAAGPALAPGATAQVAAALAVAIAATLLEAVASRGTDNLVVPCGVALLLGR